MNEADTHAEFIDKQLEAAGWTTGGDVRVQREYEISAGEIRSSGIHTGNLKADYVLSSTSSWLLLKLKATNWM